ncbi:hypothetical protein EG329_008732 [Mollisiaceae sp. DMI_Dod_QoI]|nr:hypothetical protein EG329_008732 [Helotiales sp. DMI_Dod_QoI]
MRRNSSTWSAAKEQQRLEAIMNRQDPRPCIINSPSVAIEEMAPGNICWLPGKVQVPEDVPCVRGGHCSMKKLRDQGFWHPLVVLGVYQREGSMTPGDVIVRFQMLSTYNKVELDNYIEFKPRLIKFFGVLPIRQDPVRPELGILREPLPSAVRSPPTQVVNTTPPLPRGVTQIELSPESQLLPQQSYVETAHVWEVSMEYIKPFKFRGPYSHAYSFRISKNSYYVLAAKAGIEPQTYTPTEELRRRTQIQALDALDGWRAPDRQRPRLSPRVDSGIAVDNRNEWTLSQGENFPAYGSWDSQHPAPRNTTPFVPKPKLNPEALAFVPRPTPRLANLLPHTTSPTNTKVENKKHYYHTKNTECKLQDLQTSIATQEPLIPITFHLLSLGIGTTRHYLLPQTEADESRLISYPETRELDFSISALERQLDRGKVPEEANLMLVDSEDGEEAQCPDEFFVEW